MVKLCVMIVLALICSGCGAQQTFETVSDEMVLSASAQPCKILLTLPEETLLPAMETDSGMLYLCDGYDVAVQTLESGDLDATVRLVSGFSSSDLTVMQTISGTYPCYEFAWTSAGELGEQVGRAVILDDGSYHYVVNTVAPAKHAQEYREIWNGIFESFAIA